MPGSSLFVPPPGQIRIRIARGGPSCFFILFFIHLSGRTDHDTMRRKLLTTLPLLLALLGSAAASTQTAPAAPPAQTTPSTQPAPAGQAQPAADGSEAIRACYAEYLNDMLHGSGRRGDTLLREMLTPECYEWVLPRGGSHGRQSASPRAGHHGGCPRHADGRAARRRLVHGPLPLVAHRHPTDRDSAEGAADRRPLADRPHHADRRRQPLRRLTGYLSRRTTRQGKFTGGACSSARFFAADSVETAQKFLPCDPETGIKRTQWSNGGARKAGMGDEWSGAC